MMLSNILVLRFLPASCGCLLTSLLVWGLLSMLAHGWLLAYQLGLACTMGRLWQARRFLRVFSRLVLEASQPGSSAGPRTKESFLRSLPSQLDAL